jgi:hypothetical protein
MQTTPEPARRAEALQGLVGTLLGDQVGHVAHLRVVDGVLDAVGEGGVAFPHVDPDVEQQTLPHLALGSGHPDMGEQR